ncbi:MAG TPA: hypothetical protein VIH31_01375 [Candidatus Paceibacterota bacterium]
MDVLKELKWFLLILVGLWVIWFLTGGPKRLEDKPFIKPVKPVDTGETYR